MLKFMKLKPYRSYDGIYRWQNATSFVSLRLPRSSTLRLGAAAANATFGRLLLFRDETSFEFVGPVDCGKGSNLEAFNCYKVIQIKRYCIANKKSIAVKFGKAVRFF